MDISSIVPSSCLPGVQAEPASVVDNGDLPVAASVFDVDGLLAESFAFAVGEVDGVGRERGVAVPDRSIDVAHLAAACTTYVAVDGERAPAWADLSGVYATADGRHLQVHCNFAHHADGVLRRLGCAPDRVSVAAAIAQRGGFELESELIADGMIAAAVRSLAEWDDHPHADATRDLPLVTVERIGDADPLPLASPAADHPMDAVHVLDCSRVLAGPTAGQLLAGFGADVLRIGADHLPAVPICVMATGWGKRNASLDLRRPHDAERMDSLLADTDVWIDAYRPGALASLGFDAERAATRRPGVVVVEVSAFDWVGPWAQRRGYDSIVQSTTGVRWAGGEYRRRPGAIGDETGTGNNTGTDTEDVRGRSDSGGEDVAPGEPVGLPVQALDYATGFLAAGVAAHLVAHQRRVGGSWRARLSLLRTRNELVRRRAPREYTPSPVPVDESLLHDVNSEFGCLTTVRPVVGEPAAPPRPLGSSPAVWRR